MARAQAATNGPRLPINITTLVAGQKQREAGDLVGDGAPAQGIQLADFGVGAAGAGGAVHGGRHAGLDDAGADGVAADGSPGQLVAGRLHQRDDGRFAGAVVGAAGVGAQAGDGGGRDDAAGWVGFLRRGVEHGFCGVFGGDEDAGGKGGGGQLGREW